MTWLALMFVVSVAGSVKAEGTFTAMGSPRTVETSEEKRIEVFKRLHGVWPPTKQYPGGFGKVETEGWERAMREWEAEIRNREDHTSKWELWLDLGQMRFAKNFTPTGWGTDRLDPEVHAEVATAFASSSSIVEKEEMKSNLGLLYIDGDRDFWDFKSHLSQSLQRRVLDGIQGAVAEWVGLPADDLKLTSAYGARIYRNNSILRKHLDHLETHVLSAVYCIAIEGEEEDQEPWYLGAFPSFTGEDARVNLRPGQLFLYESAKLPHGRPGTFRGDKYVAMFVHYQPTGWTLERWDRIYALPPGWQNRQAHPEL